jgi:hypothetical protein
MSDLLLELFAWITPVMLDPKTGDLPLSSEERAIFDQFRMGWGTKDTAELLHGLTDRYGEAAGGVIEKVLSRQVELDWRHIASYECHSGTEIADFVRCLWEPLKQLGFQFTQREEGGVTSFCVTKCPVKDLADSTGLHQWLYHLACATDLYSTPAFCPKIQLHRTRLLIDGDDCCDHSYTIKAD